jgi:hypothetical protein
MNANYKGVADTIRRVLQDKNIGTRKVKVVSDKNGVTVTCKAKGLDMNDIKSLLSDYTTCVNENWGVVRTPITLIDINGFTIDINRYSERIPFKSFRGFM